MGQFGQLNHESTEMESARMSISDLYVLLLCVLYHHDKNVFDGYVLHDRQGQKSRSFKLKLRKDF